MKLVLWKILIAVAIFSTIYFGGTASAAVGDPTVTPQNLVEECLYEGCTEEEIEEAPYREVCLVFPERC